MDGDLIQKNKGEFDKALEHFKIEIGKIRTDRATPSLVEEIVVDYYGAKTPLKQIASISTPESRVIVIQPWDKNCVETIEKAILSSSLGVNPIVDNDIVRVVLPPLTEERRKEIVKMLYEQAENTRRAIRTIREKIWKEIQNMEKNANLSEDEKFIMKGKLQEITDDFNGAIDDIANAKEKEIMQG